MKDGTPITVIESIESAETAPPRPPPLPATLQERFAAFATDMILFLYLLGGWALTLRFLFSRNFSTSFSLEGSNLILFATGGAAIHFLTFLLFEGVLTATPGKFLAGISVRKKKGGTPSLVSIAVRNLLRIVDYPLFFLTGFGLIEATSGHQRLGDLLSGTMVVKTAAERPPEPSTIVYGSATARTVAFVLDLVLLASFGWGLLLCIPPDREPLSTILLNLFPLTLLLYLTLPEAIFETTCGKVLPGLKVMREGGGTAWFSNLLVRNFFRLFDTNPVGYLCVLLAAKKQRPGDLIAGTVVAKTRRSLRGWLAVPFMLLLAGSLLWLGSVNPNNFLRQDYLIRVGTWKFDPQAIFSLLLRRISSKSAMTPLGVQDQGE